MPMRIAPAAAVVSSRQPAHSAVRLPGSPTRITASRAMAMPASSARPSRITAAPPSRPWYAGQVAQRLGAQGVYAAFDLDATLGRGGPVDHRLAGRRRQGLQLRQRPFQVALAHPAFGAGQDGVGVVAFERADAAQVEDGAEPAREGGEEAVALFAARAAAAG